MTPERTRSIGRGPEAIGVLVVDADLNEIPSHSSAGIDPDRLRRKHRQDRGVLLAPLPGVRVGIGRIEASDELHGIRLGPAWWTTAGPASGNVT